VASAIPLASSADAMLAPLALAGVDGATLLGERAMLSGFRIPGCSSAGGGCRMFEARGDTIALNLARPSDRELLPALFESDDIDPEDDAALAREIQRQDADLLLARGRMLGLAIAAVREAPATSQPCVELVAGKPVPRPARPPRVLDLSALWAGPLAGHLLWLKGADVIKVESRRRPDAMREGDTALFDLLNQGKASVALDFAEDRGALLALIASSDIVIEAARPRALAQLGLDAGELTRQHGLVWITITGHGAEGEAGNWVGFGDDCAVAGGLAAALEDASGRAGFVGDAIADPLTGIAAAATAWDAWSSGRSGRFGLAMSAVTASCLHNARSSDPRRLEQELRGWAASEGLPFRAVSRRPAEKARTLGADNHLLAALAA
jgi:hypothetical protein